MLPEPVISGNWSNLAANVGFIGSHAHLLMGSASDYVAEIIDPSTPPHELVNFPYTHIVSFGYRHLISSEILDFFGRRVFNVHISLLPWNRGADPNFWSWLEGSPKGVSIHQMNSRLDLGPLVAQAPVEFGDSETLSSSYQSLLEASVQLFSEVSENLFSGVLRDISSDLKGTYHRRSDLEKVRFVMESGWDTPCAVVEEWGRSLGRYQWWKMPNQST